MAADFNFGYGATGFFAWKATKGVDVAKAAYKSCIEKTNDGSLTSTGAICVFDCVNYIFGAAASITSAGYGISIVESGIGMAKEEESKDPPKKRNSIHARRLLTAFNDELLKRHGDDNGLRADAIVPSTLHPNDGYAVRMNVRNDAQDYLHLHTNGTHAAALFHSSPHTRRQGLLDTQYHYYTWSGLDGLKVEWHNINHDPNNKDDFPNIMSAWARSDLMPSPILSNADLWDFEACNKPGTATFFYGRLVFEVNRPGFNYEDVQPRGCNK
ncbi:hypothetical protein PRZ48_006650 [Zasmidium cellare]|uniref:Uncharacterized protein n=1 Tax=Zasmidium cellare TaxID=395010 RepID=A0ABR0ENP0_ZASCE|nr:hypothetical protein PRZ48_006650 [Zasmidium cellare]